MPDSELVLCFQVVIQLDLSFDDIHICFQSDGLGHDIIRLPLFQSLKRLSELDHLLFSKLVLWNA